MWDTADKKDEQQIRERFRFPSATESMRVTVSIRFHTYFYLWFSVLGCS